MHIQLAVNVMCSAEKSHRVCISMHESWGGVVCSEKFFWKHWLVANWKPKFLKSFQLDLGQQPVEWRMAGVLTQGIRDMISSSLSPKMGMNLRSMYWKGLCSLLSSSAQCREGPEKNEFRYGAQLKHLSQSPKQPNSTPASYGLYSQVLPVSLESGGAKTERVSLWYLQEHSKPISNPRPGGQYSWADGITLWYGLVQG